MRPWDGIISEDEQRAYRAAGFGRKGGIGTRPALLIIDVQYRTVGSRPMPFWEAIKEYLTSCGEVAWKAVHNIARLLAVFRERGWPVIYPHVARKETFDQGARGRKVPSIMTIPEEGYAFVREIAPLAGDVLVPKKHPSAFFGTPCQLSARFAVRYPALHRLHHLPAACEAPSSTPSPTPTNKAVVPEECVYDRSAVSHAVKLFDMSEKYADVMPLAEALQALNGLPRGPGRQTMEVST